jgi:SAM-dependent methyltransferase
MSYNVLAKYYEALIDDALYAFYLDIVSSYCPHKKVLELGCGTAYLSRELAKKGFNVTAVDQSETMLEYASLYAAMDQVDITFYQHDMHEALPLRFDLILMPIDVINHADSLNAMKTIFQHVHDALLDQGTFIFDVLTCDYIESLIGHDETLIVEDKMLHWQVIKGEEACSLKHIIHVDGKTDTHQARSYPLKAIEDAFSPFSCHDKIMLEDRVIYILKK